MAIVTMKEALLSYGDFPLLDMAELFLEPNERVCLVGRNGAGKSTLMRVIAKEIDLDSGLVQYQQGLKVSRLEQDPPKNATGSVFEYVAMGLQNVGEALNKYHALLDIIATDPSEENFDKLAKIQDRLEDIGAWHFNSKIENVLLELGLNSETLLSDLSGGWQRKAALAKALVVEPDLLLLDEPTNHLDVEAIQWLETFLKGYNGTIVFISHDRAFIESMATRIIDLDRGKLTSWPGTYSQFLLDKEEFIRVENEHNALFDKRLAQEEVWIRQGIKARRTRNEGRVRALKELRNERSQRREVQGKVKMQLDNAVRSGKIVFEAEKINYTIDNKVIVKDLSFNILRGDRIALIGPNGCGKSTLLKILLDELKVDSGFLHCGTKLEVAYFDQYRDELELDKTVMDNLAAGKTEVEVGGKRKHVMGYLQDFLFEPKRARVPVSALSGGEKNRLLLAKLFLKPANLLVMDEPTNDLDIETLELLEELLANYGGTLLLVSHDREFINNTVTDSWFFEGDGIIEQYVGGYYDAYRQRDSYHKRLQQEQVAKPKKLVKNENKPKLKAKQKLSYNEKCELESLPLKIEKLETQVTNLQAQINSPEFFAKSAEITQEALSNLAILEKTLEDDFMRWEELDALN